MSLSYNYARAYSQDGTLTWNKPGNYWKVMLVTTGYVPNPDHQFVSSVSDYEVSGTGYDPGYENSGRIILSGRTITTSLATNKVYLDADDIRWTGINVGMVGGAIIIFESGGSDATSILYAYHNGGGFPTNTIGGDLTISWSASGIINII